MSPDVIGTGGVVAAAANIPGAAVEILSGYTLTSSGSVYATVFTAN